MLRSVGLAVVTSCALFGQLAVPTPSFEVASVRRAAPDPNIRPCLCEPPGRIAYRRSNLRMIVERAYNLQDPQVAGPDWLATETYDIEARLPEGASTQQVPAMLRTLLAERFKLSAHTVSKEGSTFVLVVGKGGSKLPPAKPDVPYQYRNDRTGTHVRWNSTLSNLAHYLAIQLASPVQDRTGLEGMFAIDLDFAPEALLARMANSAARDVELAPPLPTALEEQLGLKLERRKAQVEVLEIDHIEKVPTEN